uniref:hypothetical protein n=1 Tax=Rhodoblastus sp. TaxID=1962975 RepID=UPI0035B247A4
MIYYDITDLLRYFDEHPHVTGIQRVTIATIRQFLELADAEGTGETLGLIAYDPTLGRAMATDAGFFRQENLIGGQIR